MKILYGFYKSDAGEISINGQPVQIHSPHDARNQRIGMVFQDLNLIPAFSVAENITLFLPGLKSVIDPEEIGKKITDVSRQYDLHVNPRSLASQLSLGEQQKVEILKLLLSDARILILDEPTRVLAPHEVEGLFRVLDNLRKDGFAIILITHKLQEVLNSADRVTVLLAGKVAGTMLRETADQQKLIAMMFEKTITEIDRSGPVAATEISKPILELSGISTLSDGSNIGLKDINLEIHPGEIVGIAGVSGNGQRELGEMILGMDPIRQGKKVLLGKTPRITALGNCAAKA